MINEDLWKVVKKLGEGTELTDLSFEEQSLLDRNGLIVNTIENGKTHYIISDEGKVLIEMAKEALKDVFE